MVAIKDLSQDEQDLMMRASALAARRHQHDLRMRAYYEGQQRLDQIGLAVPPELRRFETVVNWPRVVVDEVVNRLDVRGFVEPGQDATSTELAEHYEANDLGSALPMLFSETAQFGRGFVQVGTNPQDPEHPLITVEPTQQMSAVFGANRTMLACLRRYHDWDGTRLLTLYLPDATVWLAATSSGWVVQDRDDHRLGRVPVQMFLNRQRPGNWWGTSEMADTIPLTDAAARSLTNLQVAQEGLAVPARYIFGIDPKKMVDKDGNPIPLWEAYYTSLMVYANQQGVSEVKAGQFTAADLKNFTETVNHYGGLVASTSGLPIRYFVVSTANPAAEGAIRADEGRLIKNAERKQTSWGDGLGWVMGLTKRIATGAWPQAAKIRTLWFDAGTPTFSQRADGIQKLAGGVPILSREGAWDEMGWSEARKQLERDNFARQNADPVLTDIANKVSSAFAGSAAQ